jgi:hypothetical protein
MVPFFILYLKQSIPYFAALLSHILIGDFFTGGAQLFWPLSNSAIGALNFEVNSMLSAITELKLFAVTMLIMSKQGDLQTLLKINSKNWALIILLGPINRTCDFIWPMTRKRSPNYSYDSKLFLDRLIRLFTVYLAKVKKKN